MAETNVLLDQVPYDIIKIKTNYFSVDEPYYAHNQDKGIEIQMGHEIGLNGETNVIELRIFIRLFVKDSPSKDIATTRVHNVFQVPSLKDYWKSDRYIFPTTFILAIISVSISHTRALFSHNLAGTLLQDFVLPITNTVDVAKRFYPNIFDESGENMLSNIELVQSTNYMVAE